MEKSAEDKEDVVDMDDTEEAEDPSFALRDDEVEEERDNTLRLPGQSSGHEQSNFASDSTGLPQGSGSITQLGGSIIPSLADKSAAGAEAVTALPGGFPG